MKFYEVWVSSPSFHGKEPLTYSCESALTVGAVVQVPLQRKTAIGIVNKEVSKPSFATKSLSLIPESAVVPAELIRLIPWLQSYYPAPLGQITSLMVPSNVAQKSRTTNTSKTNNAKQPPSLPVLTEEQSAAIKAISPGSSRSYLLHGETGSGKTRVYLELAKNSIAENKSVIILTPEIGLTPQLVEFFSAHFPDQTAVIHSHLTSAQRRKVWLRIANSEEPLVVIGPRSALFAPIKNVGLIVIDEAHDSAYKQEQAPHYQATRVGAQLANLHNAKLILGSATPNVADYYMFETKKLPIIRMNKQAASSEAKLENIQIVAINKRENFTRSSWLSDALLTKIHDAQRAGTQSLIFLNRRGSARIVMCQSCSWHALCPKCDLPLTYHADSHKLRCHTCGYTDRSPTSCPTCKSSDILYKSIGTKAITEELRKLFPEAQIARFDSDNTKSERLDEHHQSIHEGNIDILVGTQMLTKGLDLPKLSVVGIVTADTALSFPDYTAEEITYQQLSQVMGRVGRGHVDGSVVIQTYYPENPGLKAVVDKNYSLFYQQQISERNKFLFPPFSYTLKLNCGRKSANSAKKTCENLYTFITSLPLSIEIIGPTPSFKEKQNDTYYWQIIVKAKKRDQLTAIINQLPSQISYDIDPNNLL